MYDSLKLRRSEMQYDYLSLEDEHAPPSCVSPTCEDMTSWHHLDKNREGLLHHEYTEHREGSLFKLGFSGFGNFHFLKS